MIPIVSAPRPAAADSAPPRRRPRLLRRSGRPSACGAFVSLFCASWVVVTAVVSLNSAHAFAPVIRPVGRRAPPLPIFNKSTGASTSSSRIVALFAGYNQEWQRSAGGYHSDHRRFTGGGGGGGTKNVKSKRQERVAQLVQTELSRIIYTGRIKGHGAEYLEDELRCRIAVVSADVSPDLRQARIAVSVRRRSSGSGSSSPKAAVTATRIAAPNEVEKVGDEVNGDQNDDDDDDDIGDDDQVYNKENDDDDDDDDDGEYNDYPSADIAAGPTATTATSPAVDRRRAHAWLVRNAKPIRYALAQRLSHMKACPDLTFVPVDVTAAVDVMYLIDRVTSMGYKRDSVYPLFHPDDRVGLNQDVDDDDDDDDDGWDEENGDFFKAKASSS